VHAEYAAYRLTFPTEFISPDPDQALQRPPMGSGLWEIRTNLPTKRTARVLLSLYREHLVALHGFIKKTRAAPDEDLALARKRKKELDQ
jgi:phage-related protein